MIVYVLLHESWGCGDPECCDSSSYSINNKGFLNKDNAEKYAKESGDEVVEVEITENMDGNVE